MALDKNFRSALNGFNRSDVVNFIEESSIAQEKALRQLRDENAKLRDENTKLHSAIGKLHSEKDELTEALDAQRATSAPEAEEPLGPAESETIPRVTASAPAPAAQVPSELELAAYRRAEAMERAARLRANRLCSQVNDIMESAAAKMADSTGDVEALMQDLSINLRRMTDTFAALKLTFDDTVGALESMDLLDTADCGL